jgi:vacuolar protein sorting-associated protein 53
MTTLLAKAESTKTLPVSLLLETLQQTLEFEAAMAKKYATPVGPLTHLCILYTTSLAFAKFGDILKASSPTMARQVMPISTAWEAHLGVFVDAQDKCVITTVCMPSF